MLNFSKRFSLALYNNISSYWNHPFLCLAPLCRDRDRYSNPSSVSSPSLHRRALSSTLKTWITPRSKSPTFIPVYSSFSSIPPTWRYFLTHLVMAWFYQIPDPTIQLDINIQVDFGFGLLCYVYWSPWFDHAYFRIKLLSHASFCNFWPTSWVWTCIRQTFSSIVFDCNAFPEPLSPYHGITPPILGSGTKLRLYVYLQVDVALELLVYVCFELKFINLMVFPEPLQLKLQWNRVLFCILYLQVNFELAFFNFYFALH